MAQLSIPGRGKPTPPWRSPSPNSLGTDSAPEPFPICDVWQRCDASGFVSLELPSSDLGSWWLACVSQREATLEILMIVLGVHGGDSFPEDSSRSGYSDHDAAAVLVRDGEVLVAIEEERLTRIKHTNCFPVNAIRHCLREAGLAWADIDYVATNISQDNAEAADAIALLEADAASTRCMLKERGLAARFRRAFGVDVSSRLRFCPHHIAHAWSAFAPSGLEQALILSLDGNGDGLSGMVLTGNSEGLNVLRRYPDSQSLGHLYVSLIKILGFSRFEEYKAMGLAPYGDAATYAEMFSQMYRLLPEGGYELKTPLERYAVLLEAGLLEQARTQEEPFSQSHRDFAAGLQSLLEVIVFHILTYYKALTGESSLCLAGGVAHNCSMNGKILRSGLFRKVFVQPAAHDAGGALGAAWWVFHEATKTAPRTTLTHLSYGRGLGSSDEIKRSLARWDAMLEYETANDVASTTADLLSQGAIVGWVQGRAEFGPRALGNRSILADPRPSSNKLIINRMIKKREEFRPFAPAVTRESASQIFDMPKGVSELPFMVVVVEVREPFAALLGAVTHVDRTARIQTVSKESNPIFWRALDAFGCIAGIPVLLNTSFNCNAEPIVDSIDDAVACFLTTELPYLVVGDFVVTKKRVAEGRKDLLHLRPVLRGDRRLCRRIHQAGSDAEWITEICSTQSRFFGPTAARISRDMFVVLSRADGQTSLGSLADMAGIEPEQLSYLESELFDLWSRRWLHCLPARY